MVNLDVELVELEFSFVVSFNFLPEHNQITQLKFTVCGNVAPQIN